MLEVCMSYSDHRNKTSFPSRHTSPTMAIHFLLWSAIALYLPAPVLTTLPDCVRNVTTPIIVNGCNVYGCSAFEVCTVTGRCTPDFCNVTTACPCGYHCSTDSRCIPDPLPGTDNPCQNGTRWDQSRGTCLDPTKQNDCHIIGCPPTWACSGNGNCSPPGGYLQCGSNQMWDRDTNSCMTLVVRPPRSVRRIWRL